jgi:hypothetical protein
MNLQAQIRGVTHKTNLRVLETYHEQTQER